MRPQLPYALIRSVVVRMARQIAVFNASSNSCQCLVKQFALFIVHHI